MVNLGIFMADSIKGVGKGWVRDAGPDDSGYGFHTVMGEAEEAHTYLSPSLLC